MAQKKNTRGNKNTATIPSEDLTLNEMRETTKERFALTKESIQVKANYQKAFVQLNNYNKVIKTFLKEYGIHLNLKELASLAANRGYKAEKLQELTLENLQKIFVAGRVFKSVTTKATGLMGGTETKQVEVSIEDLNKIMIDIANLDLNSFKSALKLVNKSIYYYNNSGMNYEQKAAADKYQKTITDYVSSLQNMDLEALETHFFEPLLLETKSKTSIAISKIIKNIKEAHEAFIGRETLTDTMYKSSSAEVIEAINNNEYKCQNPNNDPEITKNNNKAIQKISGEAENLELPQETAIYSDFVFHSEHATSQCELQETLRLEKNFHAAKAIILAEQILRDCSQAQIKELNANYDIEISELSTSTDVAISNNNQEKCDRLEKNYHTFDANIAYLFAYKTADDAEILAAMEKVKPVVSIDIEGETTISDTSLKSKHSTDSANIKGFTEIREDLSKSNENAVIRAIAAKQGDLNLEDKISFYGTNPLEEETGSIAPTCVGNVNDTDCAAL